MTAWVLVFVGIALAGVVMVVCFAVWLWRKATALLSEVGTLLERADELVALADQIALPADRPHPGSAPDGWSVEHGSEIEEYEIGLSRRSAT